MKGLSQRTTLCAALVGGASAFVGAPLLRPSPAFGLRGVLRVFQSSAAEHEMSHYPLRRPVCTRAECSRPPLLDRRLTLLEGVYAPPLQSTIKFMMVDD